MVVKFHIKTLFTLYTHLKLSFYTTLTTHLGLNSYTIKWSYCCMYNWFKNWGKWNII